MDQSNTSPVYLARCTETLLDALSEARALIVQGQCGERLAETLHFANDLVDIIADGVREFGYDPGAQSAVEYLAGQVRSLGTFVRAAEGTH